eukprot:CAMPEP_0194158238 /NCGR_PEP_ID=MMETSP0152-20130528/75267_1 /TAXON_ID=1049557 /ORGANISM="Thalassiothrix antarctica, Strain L6-D1" /LENGTH=1319 /DNA_ID=CAMNT_0038867331 /DNA_START=220 /DNA_END=4179 /DNA_ORIENTATION=-
MLLEPMIANALCEADNPDESTILLRAVIERFGRKVGSFPHSDGEGVGVNGTGLTQHAIEMVSAHGLQHPASWLLAGTSQFERNSQSKILPSWIPMSTKALASPDPDSHLHVLSHGEQYFMDYVKSPDYNMSSTLPRSSDPSSIFSHELAFVAMEKGDIAGALRLLDLTGTEGSESTLFYILSSIQVDPFADVTPALKVLSGMVGDERSSTNFNLVSALAALVLHLRTQKHLENVKNAGKEANLQTKKKKLNEDFCFQWVRQLAPSIQQNYCRQRVRHCLMGESTIDKAVTRKLETLEPDSKWNTDCNESKHIWNEGPFKDRENLLLLERMEDWLGQKRPAILGKEGAQVALERGEKTLADILNCANNNDDDSLGGTGVEHDGGNGWINGIGEGRTDEDNLSAYFRMSEGADEDSIWKTNGLEDLTKHKNKLKIIGQDIIKLKESSSSVDIGEPGKVKPLYDITFDEPHDDSPAGFLMEVPRGSSCDVGMLHGPIHDSRKRCTLEFWFHVPAADEVVEEIILVRRCICKTEEDLSKLCSSTHRENFVWELALLPSAELEFRTSGGTILNSSDSGDDEDFGGKSSDMMGDFGGDDESTTEMSAHGEIFWQRWNHVCLIFSSKNQETLTECSVTIMMKGLRVASTTARIIPPGLDEEKLEDSTAVDGALIDSVILFGLNPVGNLRITELRLWSCERNEDDIKMMMYEYLRAAETKKKFKVKIRSKNKGDTEKKKVKMEGSTLIAPPKYGKGRLAFPRSSIHSRPRGFLLPPPPSHHNNEQEDDVLPIDEKNKNENFFDFIPPLDINTEQESKEETQNQSVSNESVDASGFPTTTSPDVAITQSHSANSAWDIPGSFSPTGISSSFSEGESTFSNQSKKEAKISQKSSAVKSIINSVPEASDTQQLVRRSLPLSRQVRSSAAAALVRGPPATRHFGGNCGGLERLITANRTDSGRFGVGSIAICGAEKTVVYKFDRSPPGKIYPIGASGAIISDEMDNEGSEYLCCFLAKDKRMVVFELTSKTVVVELQMTTKLNYWRYLPPQANGHTLVFMLITPVGGFHWMPLDESPRPRQVWKRGPDLQGKKIVAYEEGGNNGKKGSDARSMLALILVSQASSGTPLEAWLMPICGDSLAVCVSSNLLGACLFQPNQVSKAFLPLMVTANKKNEKDITIQVQPLYDSLSTSIIVGETLTSLIVDQREVHQLDFVPPTLAMGTWPEVLICCFENLVVAMVRRKGLLLAYEFNDGNLTLNCQESLGQYIVDAGVRFGGTVPIGKEMAEAVLLLACGDKSKDGQIVSVLIEYSSSAKTDVKASDYRNQVEDYI